MRVGNRHLLRDTSNLINRYTITAQRNDTAMMRTIRLFFLLLGTAGITAAFMNPIQRAQFVTAASPSISLRMSEEESPKTSLDGTFYDDEVDLTPVKPAISNAMRDRLLAEASAGLDSESKQANVLLYIMGAVAVLVLLAGQGIFY